MLPWGDRLPPSPQKGNTTGPETEKRALQEMNEAFQFLLCNPSETRIFDSFWTELARPLGVLDIPQSGLYQER